MSADGPSGGHESRPRDFVPVEDAKEGELLLREASKALASVFFWTKDQALSFGTHITHHAPEQNFFLADLPGDVDPAAVQAAIARVGAAECYFSVSLTRANVFFNAKFLGVDHHGLRFSSPSRIFKVQRRRNLRFPIPDGHVIKASIQDPTFPEKTLTRKVLDLSTGGMSVLFQIEELPLLHPELRLKRVSFSIRGRLIECEAEVRHVRYVTDHPRHTGVFTGLQFIGLGKPDEAWISAYVFEETRKYYSKYI